MDIDRKTDLDIDVDTDLEIQTQVYQGQWQAKQIFNQWLLAQGDKKSHKTSMCVIMLMFCQRKLSFQFKVDSLWTWKALLGKVMFAQNVEPKASAVQVPDGETEPRESMGSH